MPCRWCMLEADEHRSGLVDHTYTEQGDPSPARVAVRAGVNADLVLRKALMDKHLITEADLRKAERHVRSLSQEAVPDGQDR
jgi:hypothetical protein